MSTAVGRIVAEVLGEHHITNLIAGVAECVGCDWVASSGTLSFAAHDQHLAEVIEERLGVVERDEIGREIDNRMLSLIQRHPDDDWYVAPTHRRIITRVELTGEWTEATDV